MWINIGRELGFDTNPLVATAVVALYLYLQFMKTSMEQSMNASEDVSTYFDVTLVGYENAIKNGYPQCGYLSLVIWICFLMINSTFLLIGCVRDGDVVCLAGLYGVYEMIWEFVRVDPHWTRRKIIIIQYFLKKFYHSSEYGTTRE